MTRTKIALFCLAVLLTGAAFIGYRSVFGGLPPVDDLPARLQTPSLRLTDRNGRLLYEALPEQGGRHTVLPLDRISIHLQQATLATEDRFFYTNPGIDLRGLIRAFLGALRGQEGPGGSTITQQLARNLLLSDQERGERSLRRKLREIYLALQLTRRYSKDEILALYLNQTYYGGMAYGAEAAAQTYFAKPAAELDLAESALLAGLPQAPAHYDPFTDLDAARSRQKIVLGLMVQAGFITTEQRDLAAREPLVLAAAPYPIEAPHFVMLARRELAGLGLEGEAARSGGLIVRTTLDLDWQHAAERAITRQLEALRRTEDGLGHNVNSAALVALNPRNGETLAMVGSPDYFDAAISGAINMVTAPRQPGSALKPLVYAAAFDPQSPEPWTAATMLLDVRTAFLTRDGKAYLPENYDRQEHGPVLARQALASSLNIPAVVTLEHAGLPAFFDLLGDLGVNTLGDPLNYDLSIALGGGEVRLLDLTAAYGAFANGGYRVQPFAILKVFTPSGETIYDAPNIQPKRVLDERVAWLISDILSDDEARRLGFAPNSALRLDRPAAVKTGTTSNFHDNWTVGYTIDLVAGVWVGNPDYRPMRAVDGLSGAAPIWHAFMRSVLTGRPEQSFARPDGLVQVEVCALSGLLPGEACPYRWMEWFLDGTQPVESDPFYQTVMVDAATGLPAGPETPTEQVRRQTVLNLPSQAQPWARAQGLLLAGDLLPNDGTGANPDGYSPAQPQVLRIVSPAEGSLYYLAAGFDADSQRVRVQAVGPAGAAEVRLWIDDQLIASLHGEPPYTAWWVLAAGEHEAWAEGYLPDGKRFSSPRVRFQVLQEMGN